MLPRLFCFLTLAAVMMSSAVQAQDPLPAGPSAFVLIARLHALPGHADQVVAMSAAVDKKVEAGEPGMLLHTFDRDPSDPQGFIWTEVYENSEALVFHLNNAIWVRTSRRSRRSWTNLLLSYMARCRMRRSRL